VSADEEWSVVAATRRQRDAEDRVLVLHSQGLPADARRAAGGWDVATPSSVAERARELLREWEVENRRVPEPPLEPLAPFPWPALVALALALLGFFEVTGERAAHSHWFAEGGARALRILEGEWWRATTALTLHADSEHVLGNVLAASVFAGTLWARFGAGVGLALLVAAGTLGNLANAWLRGPGHDSIGASTAVFAAVGALAADALVRRRVPRGGRLAPLGAGLGILAMLGTSERADVSAHFLGLGAGLLLGLPLAARVPRPPGALVQLAAGGAALAAVLGAWQLALHRGF
jgi:membrane associated rhomboid family serine protease